MRVLAGRVGLAIGRQLATSGENELAGLVRAGAGAVRPWVFLQRNRSTVGDIDHRANVTDPHTEMRTCDPLHTITNLKFHYVLLSW